MHTISLKVNNHILYLKKALRISIIAYKYNFILAYMRKTGYYYFLRLQLKKFYVATLYQKKLKKKKKLRKYRKKKKFRRFAVMRKFFKCW